MNSVELALLDRVRELESSPGRIQSLTRFDWIVNIRVNAQWYDARLMDGASIAVDRPGGLIYGTNRTR
jgi:hypothetical protein